MEEGAIVLAVGAGIATGLSVLVAFVIFLSVRNRA